MIPVYVRSSGTVAVLYRPVQPLPAAAAMSLRVHKSQDYWSPVLGLVSDQIASRAWPFTDMRWPLAVGRLGLAGWGPGPRAFTA